MIIPFYYFFFAIGISNFSKILFKDFLNKNQLESSYLIPIHPIITFISLLLYCSFSNLVLLFPLLIKSINISNQIVINSVSYSQYFLNISSILLVFYGIVKSIKIFKINNLHKLFNTSYNFLNNISIPLIISFLIYYILAPKNPNLIMFDTGYYHYPFIKFISKFGIETGLGSLYWGYGIYNLQFFGQLPFHNIFSDLGYLTPSLNIIFLATYIWFFVSEYLTFRKNDSIYYLNISYKNIVIIYFIISSLFCSSSFISTIASYSPNIPIFISGSISFYILFSTTILGKRQFSLISIFLLTIFAPLLKTSAITICLLNTTYLIIYNVKIQKGPINIFKYLGKNFYSIFKYLRKLNISIHLLILIAACYCIAIITNIVLTGYVIFPSSITGPIGDHAIDIEKVDNLKNGILSWHRYSGSLSNILPSTNFFNWFPYFIKSRNGVIVMIYWICPSLISLLLNYLNNRKVSGSKKELEKIITLNDHVILISIFAFLNTIFLIPVPSYTPWLTPVIIFLTVLSYHSFLDHNLLIIKLKKYTLYIIFTISIIGSLKFSFSNQVILANLFNVEFITEFPNLKYKTLKHKPNKWMPLNTYQDKSLNIYVSQGDQCWNIPAPCITEANYRDLLQK